jgi:hypothetical protein
VAKISFSPNVSSSDNKLIAGKDNGDGTATMQSTVTPAVSQSCTVTASANVALVATKIVNANPNRIGMMLYNNSANTIYCKYGSSGNGGTDMTFPIATFATWTMPQPIYTGAIWGIRNAGSGVVVATELFA